MLAALVLVGLVVNGAGLALRAEGHSSPPPPDLSAHGGGHVLQKNARETQKTPHGAKAVEVLEAGGHAGAAQVLEGAHEGAAAEAGKVFERAKEGAKVEQESTKAKNARLSACLAKKRIVFIGPSTSKADYMALAYFAEYGTWPDQDVITFGPPGQGQWGPNPMNEGAIHGVPLPPAVTMPVLKPGCQSAVPLTCEINYRYTNNLFNGHEACDCY